MNVAMEINVALWIMIVIAGVKILNWTGVL